MKRIYSYLAVGAITASLALSSCSVTKKLYGISEVEVPLEVVATNVPNTYKDLDRPVRLVVTSSVSNEEIHDNSNLSAFYRKALPNYTFTPSIKDFANAATTTFMQQMRFDLSHSADDQLSIDVKTFKMTWVDKKTVECNVKFAYKLTNEAGETLVPTATAEARVTLANGEMFGRGLGRTYAEALKRVNWNRIADCLRAAKTPQQEAKAQVAGEGNTALEHTVLRWYIISSPQGADVSWRVVSSSPDVANTNANFIGTTPYESTESFDIRGLTYDNSGNVQIEITCEKPGYMPQRKRFNVRQAIDQKEISAKFNLIKED